MFELRGSGESGIEHVRYRDDLVALTDDAKEATLLQIILHFEEQYETFELFMEEVKINRSLWENGKYEDPNELYESRTMEFGYHPYSPEFFYEHTFFERDDIDFQPHLDSLVRKDFLQRKRTCNQVQYRLKVLCMQVRLRELGYYDDPFYLA